TLRRVLPVSGYPRSSSSAIRCPRASWARCCGASCETRARRPRPRAPRPPFPSLAVGRLSPPSYRSLLDFAQAGAQLVDRGAEEIAGLRVRAAELTCELFHAVRLAVEPVAARDREVLGLGQIGVRVPVDAQLERVEIDLVGEDGLPGALVGVRPAVVGGVEGKGRACHRAHLRRPSSGVSL